MLFVVYSNFVLLKAYILRNPRVVSLVPRPSTPLVLITGSIQKHFCILQAINNVLDTASDQKLEV